MLYPGNKIYERANSFTVNLNGYQFALTNGVQSFPREGNISQPQYNACTNTNNVLVHKYSRLKSFICIFNVPHKLKILWGGLEIRRRPILFFYDVFDLVSDRTARTAAARAQPQMAS